MKTRILPKVTNKMGTPILLFDPISHLPLGACPKALDHEICPNKQRDPIDTVADMGRFDGLLTGKEQEFSWTTGDNRRLEHIAMIDSGAFGDVHKVLSQVK